jgi:serine/threonine protein kinase
MQATQQIEGYDTFEQIALGGMAAVYKARKISLDKPVAIKVLFPHLAQDAVYIERFKREAQSAARVQHDNIVNVLDYGESDGSHYIVMEYYDGVTLEELLEDQKVIPLDICFAVVYNVCCGLEAAHAANLVHRDIKPANIIFTRSGGVKIADFGLAKAVDKLKAVTQHGKIIGTPAYMSPEQTRGDDIGTQSDIFSLGVVAYEFACNRRPFDGRNYAEVVDKIQSSPYDPITEFNPLVDEAFEKILARMMAKGTDERYAHVSETVLDIEEAIDKVRYKRDRRTLSAYVNDPAGYREKFRDGVLAKLRSYSPPADEAAAAAATHFKRILHLDPCDKKAGEELARLQDGAATPRTETAEQPAPSPPPEPKPATKGAAEPKEKEVIIDDPDADYKVYLESIDLNRETPASFALKLSMRIRSPLPRIMALVKNMPAMVGGRLSVEKAKKLARVIHNLGGVARIEVHPVNESTGSHSIPIPRPKPKSEPEPEAERPPEESVATPKPTSEYDAPPKERPQPEGSTKSKKPSAPAGDPPPGMDTGEWEASRDKTVEHHPINERKNDVPYPNRTPTRLCPKCGWEEDADAKFCSICTFNFNKTEPLSLAQLQTDGEVENPLRRKRQDMAIPSSLMDKFYELPTNVKLGGLAAMVVLLLLIIFGR